MSRNVEEFFHNRPARWFYTFLVNVSTIIVFGGIGFMLDKYFETKPWIFLACLIISFPVSIYVQVRKIKKL